MHIDPPTHKPESPLVAINGVQLTIQDRSPTARQLLVAANLKPATDYILIRWPESGPTLELGLDEVVHLPNDSSVTEFIAIQADGIKYFVLDDERYAWSAVISETDLRRIGRISDDLEVWFENRDKKDEQVLPGAIFDLTLSGIERFYTRERVIQTWQLDVHGVMITSETSSILVKDALLKAGIDPNKGWIIRLKVKGQPKQVVELQTVIDLTQDGIERLQLLPKDINNGENAQPINRQFHLLAVDEAYLNARGCIWETINDGRRWLLIQNYTLPAGYTATVCTVAIEIPSNYPIAEIDMFYCFPPLVRLKGGVIPQTEATQTINGRSFQRWSRHRPSGVWNPDVDSVLSHLGLVDESIAREVEL